jgi:hypothetical protein
VPAKTREIGSAHESQVTARSSPMRSSRSHGSGQQGGAT